MVITLGLMSHIWFVLFILLKNALQCKIGRKRKSILSLMGVENVNVDRICPIEHNFPTFVLRLFSVTSRK